MYIYQCIIDYAYIMYIIMVIAIAIVIIVMHIYIYIHIYIYTFIYQPYHMPYQWHIYSLNTPSPAAQPGPSRLSRAQVRRGESPCRSLTASRPRWWMKDGPVVRWLVMAGEEPMNFIVISQDLFIDFQHEEQQTWTWLSQGEAYNYSIFTDPLRKSWGMVHLTLSHTSPP